MGSFEVFLETVQEIFVLKNLDKNTKTLALGLPKKFL